MNIPEGKNKTWVSIGLYDNGSDKNNRIV